MSLKLTKNFAFFYGVMLGDGCLSLGCKRRKTVFVAGSMADDIPFFEEVLIPCVKKLIDKDIPIRFRPSMGAINLHFIKNSLFDFVSSFGFPIGKKGDKLFIPKVFYEKNLVKYVISGFFATDGSLVLTDNNGTLYPRVEANGIARRLINEIGIFLNSRGINCKFYKSKRRKFDGLGNPLMRQDQYRLQMNGKENLKKFVKEIGFINPKQIEKLGRYYGCTEN